MKSLLIALSLLLAPTSHANEPLTPGPKTYGVHLFFNENEAVDTLTIQVDVYGKVRGHMSVPNDFEQDIEDVSLIGDTLSFDLFVPKNEYRPQDLVFHYVGTYFGGDDDHLIGYVTLKEQTDFVASFTAFKR